MSRINKLVGDLMKTPKYQKIIQDKIKTDSNFGHHNVIQGEYCNTSAGIGCSKKMVEQYAKEFKTILLDEINKLDNISAIERFSNAILINIKEQNRQWIIDISFDEDEVSSNSLWWEEYENGAYLPTLFAVGYKSKKTIWGYNNNGDYIHSLRERQGYNFIANAVNRFNDKYNNKIKAEYNEIYGGTLERDGLASLYF